MRRIFPNAFIDQFGKELAVNEARSPLGVVSSRGLSGHYFIQFALQLTLLLKQQLGIPDNIYEQNVPNFQTRFVARHRAGV